MRRVTFKCGEPVTNDWKVCHIFHSPWISKIWIFSIFFLFCNFYLVLCPCVLNADSWSMFLLIGTMIRFDGILPDFPYRKFGHTVPLQLTETRGLLTLIWSQPFSVCRGIMYHSLHCSVLHRVRAVNDMTFCNHDDVITWKHFPRFWPFMRGIHRSPVNSPHKGQRRGALMFSLICVWIIF